MGTPETCEEASPLFREVTVDLGNISKYQGPDQLHQHPWGCDADTRMEILVCSHYWEHWPGALLLRVGLPDLQHQSHLGVCLRSAPELLNQTHGMES